jgi:hypothetical protein
MTIILAAALLCQQPRNRVTLCISQGMSTVLPLGLTSKNVFQVSIFNGTKAPITILKENCSWGYEMISFEAKSPNRTTYVIKRLPRAWDKNFPNPEVVAPGTVALRKVSFGDGSWQGLPAGVGGKLDGWTVRIKLSVEPESELTEKGFWTRSLSSKSLPATAQ